jgi:hydroxymethylglutaryl-CoA lyase
MIENSRPSQVRIVEVGPRDGLQNEGIIVPTADKLAFIQRLQEAGCRDIEVASFVRPDRVPQMADAAEIMAGLPESRDVRWIVLIPNCPGLDRALQAGAKAIAVFTAASETFNQHNIGRSIAESLAAFQIITAQAKEEGIRVRGYVSTAFVCPYEGRITPAQVIPVVAELLAMGVDEVSVGDTIGQAEPEDVAVLTEALLPELPLSQFAYHFHDTKGMALANVSQALEFGVSIFDSAAGGLGGCPFAPGAPGNLATEALVRMLDGHGIATGIDADRIAEAGRWIRQRVALGATSR